MLSIEAIIAIVTLLVTCPPSVLVVWNCFRGPQLSSSPGQYCFTPRSSRSPFLDPTNCRFRKSIFDSSISYRHWTGSPTDTSSPIPSLPLQHFDSTTPIGELRTLLSTRLRWLFWANSYETPVFDLQPTYTRHIMFTITVEGGTQAY